MHESKYIKQEIGPSQREAEVVMRFLFLDVQTLHHNLSLSEINALKAVKAICAQNTSLTHEVIVLEEPNHAFRRINRNLEYLLKLKDKPITSSPPSPKKET